MQDIREMDLSPFRFASLELASGRFLLTRTLVLVPELDETQQLFLLSYEPLGVELAAPTRDQIYDFLMAEFDLLWRNYATQPDEGLTVGARVLKSSIHELMVAESNAAGQAG